MGLARGRASCILVGLTLLLGLPGVAVLAAFALPTLNRSASAAIDWFSMILFTLLGAALWIVYLSVQTGVPPQPAANVQKLAPGFVPQFSWPALALAVAATACWAWIVRWRTGRHRDAIWKSLVLPAGGVALGAQRHRRHPAHARALLSAPMR